MNLYKKLFLASAFCCASISATAADFDGTKTLLCALMESSECLPGTGCVTGTADSINLPNFINVDFKKKMITSKDPVTAPTDTKNKPRNAKIKRMEQIEGLTILQGAQNGRGWSMSIGHADGKMTLSASGDGAGFVVQGACTSR